jgi:hypothetical protein
LNSFASEGAFLTVTSLAFNFDNRFPTCRGVPPAIQQAAGLRCDNFGAKPKGEVIADILAAIKERRA